jgi:hypothetical protein
LRLGDISLAYEPIFPAAPIFARRWLFNLTTRGSFNSLLLISQSPTAEGRLAP